MVVVLITQVPVICADWLVPLLVVPWVGKLNCPTPYHYKGQDHQSASHPVADLFALACCSVILGTPGSTFTHFAANALGGPSVCLLPPLRTERTRPAIVRLESHGWRAMKWGRAWRENTDGELIEKDARLPAPAEPKLDWAKIWS